MDDLIPTKDNSNSALKNLTTEAAQQRRQVSKLTRDELEDKYLRMYEEYIILKKHARKQEDRIKRMATKLLRLVNDKKKLEKEGKGGGSIETQETYMELTSKIRELEKQNSQLREKLMLTKQQLTSVGPKRGTYYNVHARINTGLPGSKQLVQGDQVHIKSTKNLRVIGPLTHSPERQMHNRSPVLHYGTSPVDASRSAPRFGHSSLEAARTERSKLDDLNASLREQIHVYEMEIENLKEQLKLREAEYEEDILKIKQQITSEQKLTLQENISMIKLQREIKEKSTMLIALQERYQQLEDSTRAMKQSHDQILRELEHLNLQLQEEQNRNLSLHHELNQAGTERKKTFEMQEQISDLKKECDVLREANQNLVSSAFDLEREREWRQRENTLKVQIAQLEATLKSDLGEKGSIIDKYSQERDEHDKLQAEHRELRVEYYTMKEQMDDLNQKMKFFTKESKVDFTEIEEALVLIKQKKQREMQPPDFLQAVDDEFSKDHKKALLELQAEYAETIHELEKTRNMLIVQHKINKDYQTEVNLASSKMDDLKKEYEMKLDEYARLLDIRAARIKKLEAQLRDVAYGTRQYRLPPPDDDDTESTADFDESISLERGQNLFEIHIQQISLSKDALDFIGDEEPSLFCTWEFFEFEIQSTPVVRGPRPMFDFTSQYIVKVDDFFLHYLQKDTCTVELHQSFGQEYKTVAVCQMVFREIFDKPHGRIHGTATLTGIDCGETGIGYGTINYWVRLRVPMEQALRLYKERTKALGYIMTNERIATQAMEALDETAAMRPPDNVNELHVKIIRCSRIKSRRENVQPSPYCAYKLLDLPDHDTIIIRSTNNPEFNDHKIYSLPVTFQLDHYLRTAKLQMFVFDDTDPEVEAYLGVSEIPLLPLAHNKPIAGEFQLTRDAGKVQAGVVEVELRWQYHYLPPKVPKHEPQELEAAPDEPPQRLKPEGSSTRHELVKPVKTPSTVKKQKGPTATSTPMDKDRLSAVEAQIIPAGPKPTSRRKVQIFEQQQQPTKSPSVNEVDDTVSQVVSGFMPTMSQSISSVTDQSVDQASSVHHKPDPRSGEESEEGEELTPRPAPSRSTIQVESGSEDDYSSSNARLAADVFHGKPIPKARTQLFSSLKEPQEVTPKGSPVKSESEVPEEEEHIEEEIQEELNGESTIKEDEEALSSARHSDISESSEPRPVESDSEGVMVVRTRQAGRRKRKSKAADTVTIIISQVSLDADSPPMLDDNVKQLYVEYKFYDLDPAETETPFSLPKPKPHQPITFNFSKTIPVDMENNYERRRYLASMLLPNHSDGGRLKFTVVSEPPENVTESTGMECEDVGVAYVDMRKILKTGKDLKDQNIDLLDVTEEERVIGQMMVTVECVEVLREVENEMQVDGTY